jgi:hypothetical protein
MMEIKLFYVYENCSNLLFVNVLLYHHNYGILYRFIEFISYKNRVLHSLFYWFEDMDGCNL